MALLIERGEDWVAIGESIHDLWVNDALDFVTASSVVSARVWQPGKTGHTAKPSASLSIASGAGHSRTVAFSSGVRALNS